MPEKFSYHQRPKYKTLAYQSPGMKQRKASAFLYSHRRWRSLRKQVILSNPICQACNRAPSTQVDHIKPYSGDVSTFYDIDNLQALCHSCHSKKTATERGHNVAQ